GGQPGRDVVVPADPDVGQDRGDDVVPEGEQRRYGPGGRAGQIGVPVVLAEKTTDIADLY
ncbi:MAG: hypothetical protein ACREOE_11970, partial [Gemmatimonadales bacterium]